jgi:hypothetical protein
MDTLFGVIKGLLQIIRCMLLLLFIKAEYPVTKMLNNLIPCIFLNFYKHITDRIILLVIILLNKILPTMNSIVEVRETLIVCVSAESKKTLHFL